MTLLVTLFLAHLLGDFVLQSSKWVELKEKKKLKAWPLYVHTLIHGVLIMIIVFDTNFWLPALTIAVTHGVIDAIKIVMQNERTKRSWFILDQILHIMVLVIVWMMVEKPLFDFNPLHDASTLYFITAIVFVTTPASIIIKTLISQWTPKGTNGEEGNSLPAAGKFIGILERLSILAFIVTNHWEAVGFLLAAKSVFRFGDLKDAQDRQLTEYVLIGTLLSFGIAIFTGLVLTSLMD